MIIKVADTENFLDEAAEIFYEEEVSDMGVNERSVFFEENKFIPVLAKAFSKQILNTGEDLDTHYIKEKIDSLFNREISEFIFEESIEILKNEYNISFNEKKI